MFVKNWMRTVLIWVLVLCMVTGPLTLSANAQEDTDGVFHYVSLGASNTNGYGMRGYITEEELGLLLSGQVSKDDVNVYGYERTPEGAYPDLIRDYYSEIYGAENVSVHQLAISSMRAEELRVLLDEEYNGDSYTAWRFTGDGGWFESAEPGGLDALRDAYRESIVNADLVTVDIGWNNFGVYVCNQLVDYMSNGKYKWTTDISSIYESEAEIEAAEQAKAIIGEYIVANVGEGQMADALTDIFAYSILGYMHNFDICMEKIYEMNPDVDVVVLGIQNLLHGVVVELNGNQIPLGDIFGNFVNMANYYVSACSPYQSRYQYVKAGEDEHVTIFLDYMKSYDGNVESLDQNIKDCFDYYDNDLFIQTRIDYIAAALIEDEYGDMLSLIGYNSGAEVVSAGKKGELPSIGSMNLQDTFDGMYWPALNAAYDTLSELVKEIANLSVVDGNGLVGGTVDIGAVEDKLAEAIFAEVQENALAAANGEAYSVEVDKILTDATDAVVGAMYIRYYMGNSFYAHPNGTGHAEIRDAVIGIINNPESEKDQALSDYLIESVHEMHQLICGGSGHDLIEGVCSVCGYAKESEPSEPEHQHSFGEWVIVKAPSNTEEGIEERSCTCGEKEQRKVSRLSNPFTDVKESDFFYEPVLWAYHNKITSGVTATNFGPESACTRGQIVTFLWRAAGSPESVSSENPFKDVSAEKYYYKAVLWAVESGITSGASADEFEPNGICTRDQVVTFLWRAAGSPDVSAENPFLDVNADAYYYNAVLWAVESGITSGVDAKHFGPMMLCTRGQIVTFLHRAFA